MAKKAKGENQKTAGEKRAAARRINRESRERISAMTNQQLKGFFGGFERDDLDRIEKALSRVRAEFREQQLAEIEKKIEALKAQQKELSQG